MSILVINFKFYQTNTKIYSKPQNLNQTSLKSKNFQPHPKHLNPTQIITHLKNPNYLLLPSSPIPTPVFSIPFLSNPTSNNLILSTVHFITFIFFSTFFVTTFSSKFFLTVAIIFFHCERFSFFSSSSALFWINWIPLNGEGVKALVLLVLISLIEGETLGVCFKAEKFTSLEKVL